MWPDTLAERIAGWTREIRRIRVALHPTAIQTGCGLPGHSCRWDRAVRSPAQKMPRERLQCSQMQPETLVSEDAEHRKWLSTMSSWENISMPDSASYNELKNTVYLFLASLVFLAAHKLCLVTVNRRLSSYDVQASHCVGFSCVWQGL